MTTFETKPVHWSRTVEPVYDWSEIDPGAGKWMGYSSGDAIV